MNTEIAAYNPTKAALVDLAARYKGLVFEVTTPKGMAEAKAAYKDINSHSIALENARKAEKAESLAYGRRVDAEAAQINAQLEVLRLPIKEQIETETKREERERQAAIKAEQDRILAEQAAAKAAEEKRMAEARAEIAKQQAEIAKAAAESRAKIEAEERAARLKIEEEQRQERLARQAREEVERQKRAAEEAKLKAERDALEAKRREVEEAERKERAIAEAKAKAERDAKEAIEREAKRKADELLGAAAMIKTFRERYGHLPQYATIIKAIDDLAGAI